MKNYEPKPLFLERMEKLLGKEFKDYLEILKEPVLNSIRCNTLKITPEKLKKRLESKDWKIEQPFNDYPEIMVIKNALGPGELGRSMEHLLGYYYVQEIASMLPVLALKPKAEELVLDIAAAPGSKTTQISATMENTGTLIANDVNLKRLKILASNMERCGATNGIIVRKEGIALCRKMKENGLYFNKILVDAPCSGEGTVRSSPITYKMWNENTIKFLSRVQKNLLESALEILEVDGELVYSTCTHAPEENEEVVDFVLKKFGDKIKIESVRLPLTCRPGVSSWENKDYDKEVKKTCRIYPQDNNTEGFFICKIRRVK